MENIAETIDEAGRLVAAGKERRAADLLTIAASECHDPAKSAMIRAFAVQRREQAGRFGKRRWDEAIRITEKRLAGSREV